jgi:hypothetical protein
MSLLRLFLLPLGCLCFFSAAGQTINWATDVAPILYEHCVSCHRDGSIGHFSLVSYGDAYSNRFEILDATSNRRMPPWKPDPNYRHFAGENRLTDAQIQTIQAWVDADAPQGDPAQAPDLPVFSDGSSVGNPDHMLSTPFYTVTATDDEYRCFVIPNGLLQTRFLRGLEAVPGNHEVVHHILIYEDTTGQAQLLDAQTPEPGYVSFGGTGVNGSRLVGAWVPGAQTRLLPPFLGVKLKAGADLIVQMHYPSGSEGKSDMTALNFFFTPGNQGVREVTLAPLINHSPFSLENYPLMIPPNTVKEYHAKFKTPVPGSLISVGPHMHLIGRSMKCFAVTLQNDTIPLINIPEWDFHWQGSYTFQHVQKIPFGATLHAYATYDNTLNNPFQPSNPPQLVTQGEATTDEMLLVYFAYMNYQNGDENILLDSTLLASAIRDMPQEIGRLEVFPNPVSERLQYQFDLLSATPLRVVLCDVQGRDLQVLMEKEQLPAGHYEESALLLALAPGQYLLRLHTAGGVQVRAVHKL